MHVRQYTVAIGTSLKMHSHVIGQLAVSWLLTPTNQPPQLWTFHLTTVTPLTQNCSRRRWY